VTNTLAYHATVLSTVTASLRVLSHTGVSFSFAGKNYSNDKRTSLLQGKTKLKWFKVSLLLERGDMTQPYSQMDTYKHTSLKVT
jgi:hypothetical protein